MRDADDLTSGAEVRNEFSAVTVRVVVHGRGRRLEVRSTLFGTIALLDATQLEALSRMSPAALASLVPLGMSEWDERATPEPDTIGR